jgi:hypothetical protein
MAKININRNNINWAIQQSNTQCAIAQALIEMDDDIIYPRVTQDEIRFTSRRNGERYVFKTPPKAAKWIDKFDHNPNEVGPMSFDLDITRPAKVQPIRKPSVATRIEAAQKRSAVIRRSRVTHRPLRLPE